MDKKYCTDCRFYKKSLKMSEDGICTLTTYSVYPGQHACGKFKPSTDIHANY